MWRISIAVGFRQCWPTPAQTKSNRKSRYWREALNHFTILWPERMPAWRELPNENRVLFLQR